MLAKDIGIDLGTTNTLIHVRGQGIILDEPSLVAVDPVADQVVAVGRAAVELLQGTPSNIDGVRPLAQGVIADLDKTITMLREFLRRPGAMGRSLFRPRVAICVPAAVTTVERKAVADAAIGIGARHVTIVEEPVAAALGAGLDIFQPRGHMVVDIGGGTTDAAVLSLGDIVVSGSLRIGGDALDDAITGYFRTQHGLHIGAGMAEEVKLRIGTAHVSSYGDNSMDVRGRDLNSGLPRTVTVTGMDVHVALQNPLRKIVDLVRRVLRQTPPELVADIIDTGITLTGGGAGLAGMDQLLAEETGVKVQVAGDPQLCVASGTIKWLYKRGKAKAG